MKKGFTLAEVLITLGIIGVVSALTVPALMSNTSKNSIGASVAKAYNTLSNASEMIIAECVGNSTISGCVKNDTRLERVTGPYATLYLNYIKGGKVLTNTSSIDYTEYDGKTSYSLSSLTVTGGVNISNTIQTTDGMLFYMNSAFEQLGEKHGGYSGDALAVYVDINSKKGPNALGKDLFLFYIDDNGAVIPYGGIMWETYKNGIHNNAYGTWQSSNPCTAESDTEGAVSGVGDGLTCAGSIADNGWTVIY